MAKSYLNSGEKSDLVKLITFYTNLEQISEQWAELNRPKDLVKFLRSARTMIDKVCFAITDELDDDARDIILSFAKKMQVKIVHNDQSRREYQEMLQMDEVVPIKINDFYDVVEACFEYCRLHCRKKKSEVKECRARIIMLQYDVPVARTNAKKNECPYKL